MNKHDVISNAIEAIPQWLQFLDDKEAEQTAILAEIQQQQAGALLEVESDPLYIEEGNEETAVSPLAWLDDDAPPPTGEPQAPIESEIKDIDASAKLSDDEAETEAEAPPWGD